MSEVGGTRSNPTIFGTITTPRGTAQVMNDRISSVECPKCRTHIRGGHRPTVYCRYCNGEITIDSEYRYLQSNNKLGVTSLEWSYHVDCYGKAVHEGKIVIQQPITEQALLMSD